MLEILPPIISTAELLEEELQQRAQLKYAKPLLSQVRLLQAACSAGLVWLGVKA